MQARKLVLLLVALIIAGGTAMLAKSVMKSPNQNAGSATTEVTATDEVLVAARDLPAGTLIKDADLKWRPWPTGAATDSFAVKGKKDTADYVGAVVRQGLRAGEPIMAGRVVRTKEQGFLAAVLEPGMRAVSIPVTPAGGVAGFVFPGDRVDVIVTHQVARRTDPDPNGRRVSETILTNVRVLALDQRTNDQATEPKVAQIATLEVTPKQAESIALVTQIGTLSLVLRSLAGNEDDAPGLNASALAVTGGVPETLGLDAPGMTWDSDVSNVLAKPGNRRGTVQTIQIMRGKETTESVFELRQ